MLKLQNEEAKESGDEIRRIFQAWMDLLVEGRLVQLPRVHSGSATGK